MVSSFALKLLGFPVFASLLSSEVQVEMESIDQKLGLRGTLDCHFRSLANAMRKMHPWSHRKLGMPLESLTCHIYHTIYASVLHSC